MKTVIVILWPERESKKSYYPCNQLSETRVFDCRPGVKTELQECCHERATRRRIFFIVVRRARHGIDLTETIVVLWPKRRFQKKLLSTESAPGHQNIRR